MTSSNEVLMIKGAIAELPKAEQDRCAEAQAKIQAIIDAYGDLGLLALAVIGATVAAS